MCPSTPLIIFSPLHPTLYTFYSFLITHSLYLILRFPSLVPSQSLSGKRPRMNQGRTKERPKNSKLEKVLFIKIGISFAFLIPTLILPRELRLTTERTPIDDRENSDSTPHLQKVLFVKIGSLKRFPLFLKKLTKVLK